MLGEWPMSLPRGCSNQGAQQRCYSGACFFVRFLLPSPYLSDARALLACLLYTEDKGALQPDITELLLQYDDAADIIDALTGGDDKRNKDHAHGTRDPLPPLPDGATGWCACRFCPSLIYSDDDLYCDFCWPVDCGCECWCLCMGHNEVDNIVGNPDELPPKPKMPKGKPTGWVTTFRWRSTAGARPACASCTKGARSTRGSPTPANCTLT